MSMTTNPHTDAVDRITGPGRHPTRTDAIDCVRAYLDAFDVVDLSEQAGELIGAAFAREGTLHALDRRPMVEVAAARGAALALALLRPATPL